jgi:hypothetical protein
MQPNALLIRQNFIIVKSGCYTESSNKTLIKLIKKKIDENPKRCHEVLSETLWTHRISKHSATKVTPFHLVYEQEVVLPMEVNMDALQIAR